MCVCVSVCSRTGTCACKAGHPSEDALGRVHSEELIEGTCECHRGRVCGVGQDWCSFLLPALRSQSECYQLGKGRGQMLWSLLWRELAAVFETPRAVRGPAASSSPPRTEPVNSLALIARRGMFLWAAGG